MLAKMDFDRLSTNTQTSEMFWDINQFTANIDPKAFQHLTDEQKSALTYYLFVPPSFIRTNCHGSGLQEFGDDALSAFNHPAGTFAMTEAPLTTLMYVYNRPIDACADRLRKEGVDNQIISDFTEWAKAYLLAKKVGDQALLDLYQQQLVSLEVAVQERVPELRRPRFLVQFEKQTGRPSNPVVIYHPSLVTTAREHPLDAAAQIIEICSKVRDFHNGRINPAEFPQVSERAILYAAEFVRWAVEQEPGILVTGRAKEVLERFPDGFGSPRYQQLGYSVAVLV